MPWTWTSFHLTWNTEEGISRSDCHCPSVPGPSHHCDTLKDTCVRNGRKPSTVAGTCEQPGWSILSMPPPLRTTTPEVAVLMFENLKYTAATLPCVGTWHSSQNKVAKWFCCKWLSLTMRNGPLWLGFADYYVIQALSSYLLCSPGDTVEPA